MSYPAIFGPQGEPYGSYAWDKYSYPKTVPGKTIGWHFSGGMIRILSIYYWDVGVNPYDDLAHTALNLVGLNILLLILLYSGISVARSDLVT